MDSFEHSAIKQFNRWAKDYDRKLFWFFNIWNSYIVKEMDPPQGASVLDVGSGTGILLKKLVQLDRQLKLSGLDLSPEMIKKAKNKLGSAAEIIEGPATNMPFADKTFDFVTCSNSFHHHPDSLKSLKEMCRVLKPGGKLFLLDPHIDGIGRRIITRAMIWAFPGEENTHLYTRNEMRQLFEQVGFTDVRQKTFWYYKLLTIGYKQ